MSVKIRCRRTGANNDPCFRIVATDSRAPRDGQCLEILGWYDPKKATRNFHLKLDRIEAWKGRGAILSETVRSLIRKAKTTPMAAAAPAEPPAPAAPASTPTA